MPSYGVATTLSAEILESWIEIPCPRCGYELEVQFMDVATQVRRWCPCCRVRIALVDEGGSVHGALADVQAAMDGLERMLKKLS